MKKLGKKSQPITTAKINEPAVGELDDQMMDDQIMKVLSRVFRKNGQIYLADLFEK